MKENNAINIKILNSTSPFLTFKKETLQTAIDRTAMSSNDSKIQQLRAQGRLRKRCKQRQMHPNKNNGGCLRQPETAASLICGFGIGLVFWTVADGMLLIAAKSLTETDNPELAQRFAVVFGRSLSAGPALSVGLFLYYAATALFQIIRTGKETPPEQLLTIPAAALHGFLNASLAVRVAFRSIIYGGSSFLDWCLWIGHVFWLYT